MAGVTASIIGAVRWDSYAAGRESQHLKMTTETVAATVSAYFQSDEDLVALTHSTVATGLTVCITPDWRG